MGGSMDVASSPITKDGWAYLVDGKGVARWLKDELQYALGEAVDGDLGQQCFIRDLQVHVDCRF